MAIDDVIVKVKPPERPVVLKSGGPILDLVCVEGENGVVEWKNGAGEKQRKLMSLACLYECKQL